MPQDDPPPQRSTDAIQQTNVVTENTTLTSVDNTTQENTSDMQVNIFSNVSDTKLLLGLSFGVLASSLLNMVLYFLIPYIPCLRRAQFNPYWTQAREMTGVSLLPRH